MKIRCFLLFLIIILISTGKHQLGITFIVHNPEVKIDDWTQEQMANSFLIAAYNYYLRKEYSRAYEVLQKGLEVDRNNKMLLYWLKKTEHYVNDKR